MGTVIDFHNPLVILVVVLVGLLLLPQAVALVTQAILALVTFTGVVAGITVFIVAFVWGAVKRLLPRKPVPMTSAQAAEFLRQKELSEFAERVRSKMNGKGLL